MAVQTNKVAGRRHLNFTCYQDILDDVHALASRPTRALGNWSLGKICRHLAIAMDMAIDGSDFKPNVFVRTAGRLLKKRFLTRPLSPGFRLSKKAAFLIPSDADTAEGIAELERAIERLTTALSQTASPIRSSDRSRATSGTRSRFATRRCIWALSCRSECVRPGNPAFWTSHPTRLGACLPAFAPISG